MYIREYASCENMINCKLSENTIHWGRGWSTQSVLWHVIIYFWITRNVLDVCPSSTCIRLLLVWLNIVAMLVIHMRSVHIRTIHVHAPWKSVFLINMELYISISCRIVLQILIRKCDERSYRIIMRLFQWITTEHSQS